MNEKMNMETEMIPSDRHPDYKTKISTVIRSNLTPGLMKEKLLSYHENDIASAMDEMTRAERCRIYSILNTDTLAEILEYSEHLSECIGELNIRKRVEILSRLEVQTSVDYLRTLEKADRNMLLDLLPEEVREKIILCSSFDEDEIGSRMTTNYISICKGISVRQAMKELVEQASKNDNISTIYVVDEEKTLMGAVDLKDLIIAREHTDLADIVMTSYPYVYANEQIDECIERIKGYSEDSIPVLDEENHLKGVLIAQDLMQLVDDELGEDYAKLAGLTAEEDMHEPLRKSIGKRLPWLIILLGLGLLVSSVVGMFEEVVAHLALIVCFQSLVLDMAGNVGTQSLAVTIRVLMDEQISGKQKVYLIWKEAKVGLVNGLILGCLSFVCIGAYLSMLKGQEITLAFSVSFCTGAALMVSMLLSGIAGTTVPIMFKKLKIDPAVASGPLITTVNDLVAVVTYYGLSWVLLINVMHL